LLIELKEREKNQEAGMTTFRLSYWTYLKGVDDSLRVGGLRFRTPGEEKYLNAPNDLSVPPVMDLEELIQIAQDIENSEIDHQEPARRWKNCTTMLARRMPPIEQRFLGYY